MDSKLLRHILQFLLIMGIQLMVLNNIQLHSFINPYIYPLFLLLLPLKTSRSFVLVIAFGLGLLMDVFANTPGLHAAASVWLAFFRPFILNRLEPNTGYGYRNAISIKQRGWKWFMEYALLGTLVHHIFYFLLEVFSFEHLLLTLSRILISTVLTLFLIAIYQSVFARN